MRVAQLWRYPVKSLLGEPLAVADVAAHGIDGDRAWAVRDLVTGHILSAKQAPPLIEGRARTEAGAVVVEVPGGTVVAAGDPGADAALSEWLGRRVGLERAPAVAAERSYERRPHHFFDSAQVHLLTTASLRHAGDLDVRRFRPNVVLDGGESPGPGDGPPEDRWVGASVGIGPVTLDVRKRCERCAMITYAQDGVDADPTLLARFRAERDARLGVLAEVARAGRVEVGQECHTLLAP